MSKKVVSLDVREDIRQGREPFSRIMQAVVALKPGEDLRLVAPFEPAPLYRVLAQHGFSHRSSPIDGGDWEVLFTRGPAAQAESAAVTPEGTPRNAKPATQEACGGTPVVDVDARGLEPPHPLVSILEALASLPAGAQLRARTDRRPMHLYPQLEERGFVGETEEQKDGSFITHIRRR